MKGTYSMSVDLLQFPQDSTVVITGAGSGIGAAASRMLAQAGTAVAVWDLNGDAANRTAAEISELGGRAHSVTVDVTDESAVTRAFADTRAHLPPARFLINNAGPSSFSKLSFTDALALAVGSMKIVTSEWLQDPASHGGSVVNVSSVAGALTGAGAHDWYAAAKAGVAGYTRYLALNRPNNIRANAVAPGTIDTPRTAGLQESEYGRQVIARNPMRRIGLPDDVAWAMTFLLSPQSEYINGVLLPVDGGALTVY
jgi:NAD(P)-dependent dehydrogenase (short-subunit alcohol dehydrogenase family)